MNEIRCKVVLCVRCGSSHLKIMDDAYGRDIHHYSILFEWPNRSSIESAFVLHNSRLVDMSKNLQKPGRAFQNVLIVDDDMMMRRLLERVLGNAGYQTTTAQNGLEALSLLETQPFNFLVTDLDMPLMNGLELCKRLRTIELHRYVYTIVLTGSHSKDTLSEPVIACLNAGADDFVKKPFDHLELVARMLSGLRVLELEERLRRLVSIDPLTLTLNRRTFFERYERIWSERSRSSDAMSCVMADIDRFKSINDTYGHLAGDYILHGVAKIMLDTFGKNDLVGRFGGEEFAMVLLDGGEEEAIRLSEQARQTVDEMDFQFDGHQIDVSTSFGVAYRECKNSSHFRLLKKADEALYSAKRNGRNQVVVSERGSEGRTIHRVVSTNQVLIVPDDSMSLDEQPQIT